MKPKGLSRFVQNSLALLTGMIGQMLLTLLIGKLLTTSLGSKDFGRLNTAVAFAGLLAILWEPGTMRVVLRYTAHYEALGQHGHTRRLIGIFYGLAAIIGTLVMAFLAFGGARYICNTNPKYAGLETALLWATLWTIILTLKGTTLTAFTGRQQMVISSSASLMVLLLSLALFHLFRNRLTVDQTLVIRLGTSVLVFTVVTFWLWHQLRNATPAEQATKEDSEERSTRAVLRDISSFWQNALLLTLLTKVYAYADKLIIGGFLPMQYVGFFSTAKVVKDPINQVIAIPLGAASPIITTRWARGDKKGAANLASLLVKYTFLLGLYFVALVMLVAKPLILLVSSEEYLPAASMLRLLALAIPPLCITSPLASALQAIGMLELITRIEVVYIALNLLLNVVLIIMLGAQGVALSPALSALVVLVIYLKLIPKHLAVRVRAKDLLAIVISAAVAFSAGLAVAPLLASWPVLAALVLQAAFCGLVYYVALIATQAVTRGERDTVVMLIGNRTLAAIAAQGFDIPYTLAERIRRALAKSH